MSRILYFILRLIGQPAIPLKNYNVVQQLLDMRLDTLRALHASYNELSKELEAIRRRNFELERRAEELLSGHDAETK